MGKWTIKEYSGDGILLDAFSTRTEKFIRGEDIDTEMDVEGLDLRPCPFCGAKPTVRMRDSGSLGAKHIRIFCGNCKVVNISERLDVTVYVSAQKEELKKITDKWNRRSNA